MPRILAAALAVMALGVAGTSGVVTAINDYPTAARADYVFGCMAANEQTRDNLQRCACSIDVIASILAYDDYVAAETVLSMRQGTGERMGLFRTAAGPRRLVNNLRRAQAEAEIRCF